RALHLRRHRLRLEAPRSVPARLRLPRDLPPLRDLGERRFRRGRLDLGAALPAHLTRRASAPPRSHGALAPATARVRARRAATAKASGLSVIERSAPARMRLRASAGSSSSATPSPARMNENSPICASAAETVVAVRSG